MTLDADCTTSTSITVPDGFTLDGNHHTITAIDPAGGHFVGGVVSSGGATMYVTQLGVSASGLANACDAGANRLRGIIFTGASGSVTHSTIDGINQGASGCQEGNAVEVRNFGDSPSTAVVEIAHDVITNYQKTGIVCNGDARCSIHENTIGASATQANLAANSVQFGFGGTGELLNNKITGNSWCCIDAAATAVLVFESNGVHIASNKIDGNSDIGIDLDFFPGDPTSDNNVVEKNQISDTGADGYYDIGIGDYGANNTVTKNAVSGFTTPFEGVTGAKNRVKPAHGAPY